MPISSPNSKRCSTASSFACGALAALLACSAFALPSFGATGVDSLTRAKILREIHQNHSSSFDQLLSRWQRGYGTAAVPALIGLARDPKASDPDRYVAMMAAAKIGGEQSAPLLCPLLHDSSWMIRDGTLRILSALNRRDAAALILPLLKDPALVVRLEAIQSVEKLKPAGAAQGLLSMVSASENYHHGKAQWVPQRALQALLHLKTLGAITTAEGRAAALRLSALLAEHRSLVSGDPAIRQQIAETARALSTFHE